MPARFTTRSEGRKEFSLASKKYFNTPSDRGKRCEPPLTALLPAQRRDRGSLGPPAPQETAGTGQEEEKEKEKEEAARTSPPAAAGSPATWRPGGRSRAVRRRPERCRRGMAGRTAGRAGALAAAAAPSPP